MISVIFAFFWVVAHWLQELPRSSQKQPGAARELSESPSMPGEAQKQPRRAQTQREGAGKEQGKKEHEEEQGSREGKQQRKEALRGERRGTALRVSQAVTRLRVYRLPQIWSSCGA